MPLISGSQKCLSCVPGLSPITFSDEAVRKFQNRKTPVNSWFSGHEPRNCILGWIREKKLPPHSSRKLCGTPYMTLLILKEEGLERSWKRHLDNHILLRDSLEDLGFRFLVDKCIDSSTTKCGDAAFIFR